MSSTEQSPRLATTTSVVRSASSLILAIAVGVIAIAVLLASLQLVHGKLQGAKPGPTMSINGNGSVLQQPDRATYQLTVHGSGATVALALEHANRYVRQVTRAATGAGVAARDITVLPSSTSQTGVKRAPWSCDVQVTIAVTELSRADNVLRVVSKLHVADLTGPDYSFNHDNQLRERAMADAIASARRKADIAAKRGGMRVTGIANMREISSQVNRPGQPGPVVYAMSNGAAGDRLVHAR